MLSFLTFGLAMSVSLRHPQHLVLKANSNSSSKLDPHCHGGVMDTTMTYCCQKDCGECSDTSDLCDADRTGALLHRETTCCPRAMGDAPSCELSTAPCKIPESVRAPASVSDLTAADVHAKDDCTKVIPATKESNHLQTAYIKFATQEFVTKSQNGGCLSTEDCGTYGTLEQAAAACSNNDDCVGFYTNSDGNPDCLVLAEDKIMGLTAGSVDTYLKREFHHTGDIFTIRSVIHKCYRKNPAGALEVKMGFCSSQVAMNEQNGAEVYEDMPRHACAPTPAPTPLPTPEPTPEPTDPSAWTEVPCKYFNNNHGDSHCTEGGGPWAKDDRASAEAACEADQQCEAIVLQTNHCDGKYRITHGDPDSEFRDYGCSGSWQDYDLHAWRLNRAVCGSPCEPPPEPAVAAHESDSCHIDVAACSAALQAAQEPGWGDYYYIAFYWPGDNICDGFMQGITECGGDCGDCR